MDNNQLKQYAQVLLVKGLNLQKNQPLVINAPVESEAFVSLLTETAYLLKAKEVIINWRSDKLTKLRYQYEGLDNFTVFPSWKRDFSLTYYRQNAAFLSLVSANPSLLKGIDSTKIMAWQKAQHTALHEYIDGMMASKVTWLVAAVATSSWARQLFPSLDEHVALNKLWSDIITASRADSPESLKVWDEHLQHLKEKREWLTEQSFQKLHYKSSNGTDLYIGLPENHIWQGGSETTIKNVEFTANIPTEEVYTAPDRNAVNGIVFNSKPLVYNGNIIDNFSITFKDGKATSVTAAKGKKLLLEMLEIDAGASYLGEVALVPYHSPISLSKILFYETLFDENASCHLAFGKAYPTCLKNGSLLNEDALDKAGINDSLIHVDFMIGTEDLTITGITAANKSIPVFINGDFAE